MLADRFGGTPQAYWHMPAIERAELLALLGVEAEVAAAYDGLEAGDEVVFVDDDDAEGE